MKALVASSAAAVLFYLIVLIRSALGQGEGYVCDYQGFICNNATCVTGSGTCPSTGQRYVAFDVMQNNPVTACVPGSDTCYLTEDITACFYTYYTRLNYLGKCVDACVQAGVLDVYVCPLD